MIAVLVDAFEEIGAADRTALGPACRIGDLEFDSLDAAEIFNKVSVAFDTDIEPRQVRNNWSDLTIAGLAAHFVEVIDQHRRLV
ncbi:phosphopantetheine-binding protein [Micromonospora sp. NPDC051296]|uniref:phosphopantetheine-binding protein n=1 Tax=Micromonospora sp. NPDC051296 TaxID=3155046 RepID=UPI00342AA093